MKTKKNNNDDKKNNKNINNEMKNARRQRAGKAEN